MIALAVAIFAGLLGLVNLLFTFGVIRRLREHTETLNDLRRRASPGVVPMLDVGSTVGDFLIDAIDGETVSRDDLDGGITLVGVFSPDCPNCEASLDTFVEYAGTHPGGRSRTLAIVIGPEEEVASYVERLADAARVVLETRDGPLSTALGLRGVPAFALLDDGRVTACGFRLSALPSTVAG